ncbi:xanthine dehydrogenase family protein molybdopterin-binding subunit [Halocynthiibacter namhaensis]|uniref:xanthine dehydrogenase family protein molybdopterin-binding subunit n=1 Tax=Halocynthiibacter namhaensis TaxID=1290553 RepID=UPI0005797EA1|nr:xanthine dehydrogenase family protein molybdopterin-binding subunit [Halocynthiibacter namhaensis]
MEKFGKSQPVKRVEDVRFLTGQGQYVDDIRPDGALVAYFFRSPVAHADITTLDLSDARDAEGVHLVWSIADLEALGIEIGLNGSVVTNRDGSDGASPLRPVLAKSRVRHVGEAIAVIIADNMEAAKDAAELIEFDFDECPVHLGLSVGGDAIHDEAPDNLAFDWGLGDETATQAAFDAAAHHVTLDIGDNRVIVNAMEPRGCFAEPDPTQDGRLHFSVNGQGVWGMKKDLSKALKIDPESIRVTNPDVGGGFGMKAMHYPEYIPVAAAARILQRPVHWMADRTESMLSDNAGRDLTSTCELAFDADHRILAYRVNTIANMGAYNSGFAQPIQTQLFSRVLMGTYDCQTTWLRVQGIYTNTTCVDAYRGAGRPEAIYALERLMDRAARELGVDPWELRRINFIKKDQFPYKAATGETYDVGDFHKVLDRAALESDQSGFAARKAKSAAAGLLRGRGLCYYIESILGDPSETSKVEFTADGGAELLVGTQSNGQGHETVYAQFLSDQSGIPIDRIKVIQGDSARIKQGGGTGGSRSGTVQNAATLECVSVIVKALTPFVATRLGVAEDDVSFDHESFRAEGSNQTPDILTVVAWAREDGREDLLQHEARITLDARSFPNGAHVAEAEIDPETGVVCIDGYAVVDDFGNLINPMVVEGQIHGGVAQGLGQAITEQVGFDEDGQLLTATFMDYAMPRADNMPWVTFVNEPTPSSYNPMGMKGCGEAGTVGSMAAVANAVQDALWERGVRQADMPFTPLRVWEMLKNASGDKL